MARRGLIMVLLGLALCMPLAGAAQAPLAEEDLLFLYDEVPYALGDPAAPLVTAIEDALGPMDVLEMESCMFDGMDKEYASSEILLATYPVGIGGADIIETIMVVEGGHRTMRDVGIGSSLAEITAAYGNGYTQDHDQITYRMDEGATAPALVFVIDLNTSCVVSFYMIRNTAG